MHVLIVRTAIAALTLPSLALAQATYSTYGAGCPGASTVGYCGIASNGKATSVTTRAPGFKNFYALQVPNSAASITVAGFELLTQRVITPSVLSVAILDSTPTGRPGRVLATGSLTVGSNMGWHRSTLATPVTITTRRPFFLQVRGNQTCRFPLAPTGKTATYYLKTPTGSKYLGPYSSLRWAWRLVCGKPGTAPKLINAPKIVASSNGGATQNTAGSTNHFNTYAFPVANSKAKVTIGGFELLTQKIAGTGTSTTLQVAIRDSTITGFPGATLASGTMTVDTTLGWHRFTLTKLLTITTGRRFFIQYTGKTDIRFPFALKGTKSTHYLRQKGATNITGPYNVIAWAWRVIGDPLPTLGNTFSVDLSSARPMAASVLIFGWSPANVDLTPVNAPGCRLLVSPSNALLFQLTTNASGMASFGVKVPPNPALRGFKFFNQYAVSDPVNGYGLVLSNGGAGKLY
jgi:hypothetical protein